MLECKGSGGSERHVEMPEKKPGDKDIENVKQQRTLKVVLMIDMHPAHIWMCSR